MVRGEQAGMTAKILEVLIRYVVFMRQEIEGDFR